MADIVLTHSAKGTTWQKKGSAYISRVKKNGKWVYTYDKKPSNRSINDEMYKADYSGVRHDAKFTKSSPKNMVGKTVKQVSDEHYSNAESMKRKSVSAQRNVQKDTRYKLNAKTAYLKNKASRNINKGKKKVNELLERLKKQASTSVTKMKNKATYASKARAQRKSKRTIARQQTIGKAKKYVKNIRSGVIYSGRDKHPTPVSKNAIKKNAGKKR